MPRISRSLFAGALPIISLLAGCASHTGDAADDSEGALEQQSSADDPVSRDRVPEPQAFLGWRDDTRTVTPPKPADVQHIPLACADKQLYPTNPQSNLKRYHRYATGQYDHFKLSGDSSVCKIPGNARDSHGVRMCMAAGELDYAMLSDTYTDSCGNTYRAFWDNLYLSNEENMGTLMSKGRRVYSVPGSQFAGEVYDAGTYAVDASDFLFLAPPFDGDAAKIESAKKDVTTAGTHRYDESTHLFEYVGPYR
jgi:hypothetical protein